MERKKIGSKTTVASDFADYSYMLNGIGGIGKTTTGVDIGQILYGEDGVILLTVGEEPKPEHMGNVFAERTATWESFATTIKTLIKYKKEDYPDLKIAVIDSANEVFRLAEEYIVSEYNNANPTKKVGSIKAAYGGFQAGENMVVDLVIKTIFPLKNVGVSPFVIGHTKKKNIKDQQSDIEYEVTTSDLDSKYYNAIKDRVSIVGCAYMEREMNDVETVKDAFTKKDKKVGRIKSEKRVLSFRDEEFAVDNKSHLKFIDAKVDFTAVAFIKTIKDAIQKQIEYYNLPISERHKMDTLLEVKKEPKATALVTANGSIDDLLGTDTPISEVNESEPIIDVAKNEEYKAKISAALSEGKDKTKAAEVKKVLAKYDSKVLDINKPTKMFEEAWDIFK